MKTYLKNTEAGYIWNNRNVAQASGWPKGKFNYFKKSGIYKI